MNFQIHNPQGKFIQVGTGIGITKHTQCYCCKCNVCSVIITTKEETWDTINQSMHIMSIKISHSNAVFLRTIFIHRILSTKQILFDLKRSIARSTSSFSSKKCFIRTMPGLKMLHSRECDGIFGFLVCRGNVLLPGKQISKPLSIDESCGKSGLQLAPALAVE